MTATIDVIADRSLKAQAPRDVGAGRLPGRRERGHPASWDRRSSPPRGVRAGDRVLDVAAGTGNAAVPAALTGAASSRPT